MLHGGKLFAQHDHSANKQAAQLVPMIEDVLAQAGIRYPQLERLITTYGPGSFTGIRIGLAAAQGLLAAMPMQLVTITTLEALAISVVSRGTDAPFWVCLNAGKGEIYSQLFHVKQAVPVAMSDISLMPPTHFALHYKKEALAGNAQALVEGAWIEGLSLPAAADFIYTSAAPTDADALTPLYIRAPDAKLPAVPLPLE